MENQSAIENLQSPMRLVFMGTPDIAVASLDALLKSGFNITGVVTAPDRPAGRGMKMHESEVKKFARKKGLTILQPEKLKNPEFLNSLRALKADLQVIVAFRMLPEVVWNMPPMGSINLHASLLPQYRGAAPINWAVINGEKETGVTTFRLKHEVDTGNILLQEKIPIGENETAGELHNKIKRIGADLLVKTIHGLIQGNLKEVAQDPIPTPLKTAPRIFTETCRIDWNRNIEEIYDLIRGLSPYPGAFTQLEGKMLKIYQSEKDKALHGLQPGTYETDGKTFLKFACRNGYLFLKDVQLEGKKRLLVEEFLRGYRFKP